jgi:hypothetical protein
VKELGINFKLGVGGRFIIPKITHAENAEVRRARKKSRNLDYMSLPHCLTLRRCVKNLGINLLTYSYDRSPFVVILLEDTTHNYYILQ